MIAWIINILHFILLVFILGTPFTCDVHMLTMHLIIVPFILLHWLVNQSVCALTELEKFVTGKTCDDETFFGRLVGPIYKFNTIEDENTFLWTGMIGLWLISFIKMLQIFIIR